MGFQTSYVLICINLKTISAGSMLTERAEALGAVVQSENLSTWKVAEGRLTQGKAALGTV